MTKSDILETLVGHYSNGNKARFAKKIGISAQGLSTWISRNTFDIDILYSKCEGISAEWLLTGKGDMLKPSEPAITKLEKADHRIHLHNAGSKPSGAIPLVSVTAVGGLTNEHFSINEDDVLAYYVIPKFCHLGVDFMIELTGDSMQPHLFAGDIIACSIIHNINFIQWNKPLLLATRDWGLIVKRLHKCDNDHCFLAVSDNTAYPPFELPKDDILGMARIVGVIHLE